MKPISPEIENQLQTAIDCFQNGECDRGIELLDELNRLLPGQPEIVCPLGRYLRYVGDLRRALPMLKQGVTLSPDCEATSLALFNTLWETGQQVEALDEIKRHYAVTGVLLPDYQSVAEDLNLKSFN